jgi:hypothetical protein
MMALEHEQQVNPVNPSAHVEGLSSVSERVVRKKERHRQSRRGKGGSGRGEQPSEESPDDKGCGDRDGHVDFRA